VVGESVRDAWRDVHEGDPERLGHLDLAILGQ
jgi:hypothetical protein